MRSGAVEKTLVEAGEGVEDNRSPNEIIVIAHSEQSEKVVGYASDHHIVVARCVSND
jgi:hypothetical protein